MFIRFVQYERDPDSGLRTGLFVAAYRAMSDPTLSPALKGPCSSLLSWFENNLSTPHRFNSTSSKGGWRRTTLGLSWFKPTATDHLRRCHELRALLEQMDVAIEIIRTKRPGYIVYEDAFQIVAEPFADTPT